MRVGIAPGAPGINPSWCSSDKDLVATAIGPARLWYTLGHGILNEVYYPRVDIPQVRDLGFIVADDAGFWLEVKRFNSYEILLPDAGIPLPTIIHRHSRFTLTLRICPDPESDVLLIDVDLEGDDRLRPYVLLAPHLGGTGLGNIAWAASHRGRRTLWAEQGPFGLALSAVGEHFSDAFGQTSAGYVGNSDLWQDFSANGRMAWQYDVAGPGNISMGGALQRKCRLALGLATSKEAAATLSLSALAQSFDDLVERQTDAWRQWHRLRESRAVALNLPNDLAAQYSTSAMVLKCHRDKTFSGAMVASLSVPWGSNGEERGGYHLVWPRDLVESATALLALGSEDEARNVLRYLIATQNADGHWYQNQWLGGRPYWSGIQLDEAAFPVLLAAALAEQEALAGIPVEDMVSRALRFLIQEGPSSPQDRWEEDAGVNPFTLATCIAALVTGAEFLSGQEASLAYSVADFWNEMVEAWTVAVDTGLGRRYGISDYYVREAPPSVVDEPCDIYRHMPIKNRAEPRNTPAAEQVALDFLQLVRLGLRRPEDPLIRNSVALADALLRTDTPSGPVWHRYSGDGYGEHPDGSPFDGTGVGRGWPLLSGERGHFALTAGEDPLHFLRGMAKMAGGGGMLPEQVWDAQPLPDCNLLPGRPTGSAMPLAWAHAEFIKLAVSRALDRPFDRPGPVWRRYQGRRCRAEEWIWTPNTPFKTLPQTRGLMFLLPFPAVIRLGGRAWSNVRDIESRPLGLMQHGVRLSAVDLVELKEVNITWRRIDDGRWIGRDFNIRVQAD